MSKISFRNIKIDKKTFRIIAITVVVLVAVLLTFERFILVSVAKNGLRHVVDLKTHMKKIALQPQKGSVTIKGLEIYNPPGYKIKTLADVSRILMDFKLKTLYEPGAFFDKIEVHIEEIYIIRDKDGVVNLSKMKALTPQKNGNKKKPFLADKYIIKIGKVYYVDRTKEEDEQIKEIELNIEEEYKNLKDPDNIAKLIAYKIFFSGKTGNIGVDIQKIQSDLAALADRNKKLSEEIKQFKEQQAEKAKEAVKQTVEKAKEAVGEQVDKTKEVIKEATDKTAQAVKDTAEDVKATVDKTKEAIGEKVEDIKEKISDNGSK